MDPVQVQETSFVFVVIEPDALLIAVALVVAVLAGLVMWWWKRKPRSN